MMLVPVFAEILTP